MRVLLIALLLAGCTTPTGETGLGLTPPEPEQCGDHFMPTVDGYSVIMDGFTREVNTTTDVAFQWTIRGPEEGARGVANQSNFVWGFNSLDLCNALQYENIEEGINGTVQLPQEHRFSVLVEVPGTYYGRAHVAVGDKHIFTPEVMFVVTQA